MKSAAGTILKLVELSTNRRLGPDGRSLLKSTMAPPRQVSRYNKIDVIIVQVQCRIHVLVVWIGYRECATICSRLYTEWAKLNDGNFLPRDAMRSVDYNKI